MSRKIIYYPLPTPYYYDGKGMDYIESCKIIADYCKAVKAGMNPDAMGFLDGRCLPDGFNKDKLIDAYKLFLAHTFFFGTYSVSEVQEIRFRLALLDLFVEGDTIINAVECSNYLDNTPALTKLFGGYQHKLMMERASYYSRTAKEKSSSFYRKNEIDDFIDFALDESIYYRKVAGKAFKENHPNQKNIFFDCLEDYYNIIYDHLGWDKSNTTLYTFATFDMMQDFLLNEETAPYLIQYKKEIFKEIKITDIF